MLDDQLPPQSTDAEQAILCAILHQPELMEAAVDLLLPEHFYRSSHQHIYRAMQDCFTKQIPIGVVALLQSLQQDSVVDAAGGKAYLYDLLLGANQNISVINDTSLRYWAKVVIDTAKRREVIIACCDIQEAAFDQTQSGYFEQAQNFFFFIEEAFQDPAEGAKDIITEALASIEQELTSPNSVTGLTTGWTKFDRLTHGLQPWQLITISARPGGGKSAAALNIAAHTAIRNRLPILYISLEMTNVELMKRVIRAIAGEAYNLGKLQEAGEYIRMHQHRFLLEDGAGLNLATIQSKILKAKKTHPELALVVVDHIGLIAPDGKQQNKTYEIQAITSRFKVLAKTIQAPIIQLAQMNRGVEARQDKKPMLSDLRDSGSIEMDSDIVVFTHIERGEDRKPTGNGSLTIAKQRDGVQEEIQMQFVPHLTLFKDTMF